MILRTKNHLCNNIRMATLKEMREELSLAGLQGHAPAIRNIAGIEGKPKDATEVFILYLAWEALLDKPGALAACNAVRRLED